MVPRIMRHYFALACLVGIALALASCGGDSSSSTSSKAAASTETETATEESTSSPVTATGPLTKAEFIAQADEICEKVKEEDASVETRFNQLNQAAKTQKEGEEAADLLRELAGYVSDGLTKVGELEPPAADTEAVNSYLKAAEGRVSTEEEIADAIAAKNKSRLESLSEEFSSNSALITEEAERYGFKVCGVASR
jgi:hypothetical protein